MEDMEATVDDEAEYIVVGAGSAGCIVAGRLAESGARVLLVEAGGRDGSPFIRIPGMITIVHTVPQIKKRFDWGYYTVPQKHASGREIPTVRGKILGGSSSINGMLFVRGHRGNYDDWAAQGCTGWGYDDVLPSFKRLEDWENGATEFRGAGGPVAVHRQKHLTPASHALLEALSETLEIPKNDDYNGESQEGVGPVQMSVHRGRRVSSSRAYLSNRSAPQPEILLNATVSRVVVAKGRAVGVEVLGKDGPKVIRAAKEVIVSAGVIGSAQILQLSGIGPAADLRRLGISVHSDLPVGKNLHDHLFVPMTFLAPSAEHRGTAAHFLGGIAAEVTKGARGSAARSSTAWRSPGRIAPATVRTSRFTACPGRIPPPTRTRRFGTRWTRVPP
jgi:choline dehydrogenase-like flavoprotein